MLDTYTDTDAAFCLYSELISFVLVHVLLKLTDLIEMEYVLPFQARIKRRSQQRHFKTGVL